MAVLETLLTRVFKIGSIELPDPDPTWSAEQVKNSYMGSYPILAQCTVGDENVDGDRLSIDFIKPQYKDKG